jgi:hypothetical protein
MTKTDRNVTEKKLLKIPYNNDFIQINSSRDKKVVHVHMGS